MGVVIGVGIVARADFAETWRREGDRCRRRLWALALSLLALLATRDGRAADSETDSAEPRADLSVAAGALLPMTIAPRIDAQRAMVVVASGYDAVQRTATLGSAADLHVVGPLALRVGLTYLPSATEQTFQPHVGLRVQVLRQERHGVDAAAGLFYRRERYTPDEGLVQAMAAVSRRSDRAGVFLNVAYGQDPEGDDRDGEVRVAALYSAASSVQVGLDGRMRVDLFSNDTRRAVRGETNLDFAVGPLACVTLGRWALIGQAGVSGVRAASLRLGPIVTLGAGSVF
jgi:hypothetical protein